uniref:Uncharacterized protein n=1 Tax=Setaria viridis TaxID=4556 RepID=A0A4U6T0W1_SETVI|nr:hypothetical protein SEVIR_9G273966v2 [Setaria viridis]
MFSFMSVYQGSNSGSQSTFSYIGSNIMLGFI